MSSSIQAPSAARERTPRRRILDGSVHVLAFSLLGAVLFFGHRTEWKMPKLSQLIHHSNAPSADWCEEHSVRESVCVECNAGLLPKPASFGYCAKHGIGECVNCHPELAEVNSTPTLPTYDGSQSLAPIEAANDQAKELLHARRVQFDSEETAAKAGIETGVVRERPMNDYLAANGELTFDPTRVAHLSSRLSGSLVQVYKVVGDEVRAGDVLALVDSARVGEAKARLLEAAVQLQLQRAVAQRARVHRDAMPERLALEAAAGLQKAEVAFVSAKQALLNLGFAPPERLEKEEAATISEQLRFLDIPAALLAKLPADTKTANLLPVRATYDGVLLQSHGVAGEVVEPGKTLFTVADPTRMLLTLNVREEDSRLVRSGLSVLFFTADGAQRLSGHVSWISPETDERTRTLPVRVELDRIAGRLRDRTFGTGQILLRSEPRAVVVPLEAVQAVEGLRVVFVRDRNFLAKEAPKLFHVREVRTGARDLQYVELLAGALPGEVVVTKGSAVLLAQLLRNSLGEGCGCQHH